MLKEIKEVNDRCWNALTTTKKASPHILLFTPRKKQGVSVAFLKSSCQDKILGGQLHLTHDVSLRKKLEVKKGQTREF